MSRAWAATLILVALGCGSEERPAAESPPPTMATTENEEVGGASYGLLTLVHSDEKETRPPEEVYGVFRDEQTPADEEAGLSIVEMLLPPSHDRPGSIDLGQLRPETVRSLQADLPGTASVLVAGITTTGGVCYGLSPSGGGSCRPPASSSFALAGQDHKGGLLLYGLVEDGVTGVEFVVDGEAREAVLGRNSYALVVGAPFDKVASAVLHRGGSSETIPIG